MSLEAHSVGGDTFVLTKPEVNLLRFTCDLYADEQSPLGPILVMEESSSLERAAASLVTRGLVDKGTFRPNRELVRRLLIVSEPDARIVLVEAQSTGSQRLVDSYIRAGACVQYRRIDDGHEVDAPTELEDLQETLLRRFSPRRSTGDFVDFSLSSTEYFAFSILAGDLVTRQSGAKNRSTSRIRVRSSVDDETPTVRNISYQGDEGPGAPVSGVFMDDGTPLDGLLRQLPPELRQGSHVPTEERWNEAIDALLAKEIIVESGNRYCLRPYLHDLAIGLANQQRVVLTRFDFGGDDWIVRDATFVAVPGSLFLVRALPDTAIRVVELDQTALESSVRYVIEPIVDVESVDFE